MARTLTVGLLLWPLLCIRVDSRALAQDNKIMAEIDNAQNTLTEIIHVIDTAQSRQAMASRNHVALTVKVVTEPAWTSLFDGTTMGGWKRTDFFGGGKVHIDPTFRGGPAAIIVDAGSALSGITWTNNVPSTNFEIMLEAMKIEGQDFMCGLTFPVGDSHASLILGGWGGSLVGISSIDDRDASENITERQMPFPKDHWFRILLRVTPEKLVAWLDEKKIVDVSIKGKKISLRHGEIFKSTPLGLATYQTTAAYREIKLRAFTAN